jgi:putative N6-adenine-specific DNA methylase
MAMNRAPGALRKNFGFMHINEFDPILYYEMIKEASAQENRHANCRIIASDIDPVAVNAARKNARSAGVDHCIDFYTCDFSETPVPEEGGVVILNPEYGARMGDVSLLESLYSRIGDYLKKRCAGYRGYVFSGNLDLLKKVGLRTSRRIIFYSGGMDCRLHEYELYKGSAKTAQP